VKENLERWKCGNGSLVNNPTQRVPGFELPWLMWTALNRIRTEQGK